MCDNSVHFPAESIHHSGAQVVYVVQLQPFARKIVVNIITVESQNFNGFQVVRRNQKNFNTLYIHSLCCARLKRGYKRICKVQSVLRHAVNPLSKTIYLPLERHPGIYGNNSGTIIGREVHLLQTRSLCSYLLWPYEVICQCPNNGLILICGLCCIHAIEPSCLIPLLTVCFSPEKILWLLSCSECLVSSHA